MDIDVARETIRNAFKIGRELQEAMQFLKERCDPLEYKKYAFDIAVAHDAVNTALLKKAIEAHPFLEKEIDEQISMYGRYL